MVDPRDNPYLMFGFPLKTGEAARLDEATIQATVSSKRKLWDERSKNEKSPAKKKEFARLHDKFKDTGRVDQDLLNPETRKQLAAAALRHVEEAAQRVMEARVGKGFLNKDDLDYLAAQAFITPEQARDFIPSGVKVIDAPAVGLPPDMNKDFPCPPVHEFLKRARDLAEVGETNLYTLIKKPSSVPTAEAVAATDAMLSGLGKKANVGNATEEDRKREALLGWAKTVFAKQEEKRKYDMAAPLGGHAPKLATMIEDCEKDIPDQSWSRILLAVAEADASIARSGGPEGLASRFAGAYIKHLDKKPRPAVSMVPCPKCGKDAPLTGGCCGLQIINTLFYRSKLAEADLLIARDDFDGARACLGEIHISLHELEGYKNSRSSLIKAERSLKERIEGERRKANKAAEAAQKAYDTKRYVEADRHLDTLEEACAALEAANAALEAASAKTNLANKRPQVRKKIEKADQEAGRIRSLTGSQREEA